MADAKKNALLAAASKLKSAKKSSAGSQNDGSKGAKRRNDKGEELKGKIRDAVSKFADE